MHPLREACSAFYADPAPPVVPQGARARGWAATRVERDVKLGKFLFGEGDSVFTFANPKLAKISIDKKVNHPTQKATGNVSRRKSREGRDSLLTYGVFVGHESNNGLKHGTS